MLRKKEMLSLSSYIEVFDRKFTNFCSKNILSLEYTIIHDMVYVNDDSGFMMEPIQYQIEVKVPIRTAIHDISMELQKFYPKFYGMYEKIFTSNEIGDLLRTHTPIEIEELALEKEAKLEYTIYRVINTHNEVDVIDHLDNDIKKAYKLFIPAMEFVNLLYTDIETARDVFKNKTKYISKI